MDVCHSDTTSSVRSVTSVVLGKLYRIQMGAVQGVSRLMNTTTDRLMKACTVRTAPYCSVLWARSINKLLVISVFILCLPQRLHTPSIHHQLSLQDFKNTDQ